jgi:predicted DNA-binding antitoxin AbrB/MazE fold protein
MSKILHAIYDGEVLRPEEDTGLQPNTRYKITIEHEEDNQDLSATEYPLTMLLDLATDMDVADLAANHDHYAHQTLEDHGDSAG